MKYTLGDLDRLTNAKEGTRSGSTMASRSRDIDSDSTNDYTLSFQGAGTLPTTGKTGERPLTRS